MTPRHATQRAGKSSWAADARRRIFKLEECPICGAGIEAGALALHADLVHVIELEGGPNDGPKAAPSPD